MSIYINCTCSQKIHDIGMYGVVILVCMVASFMYVLCELTLLEREKGLRLDMWVHDVRTN